MKTADIVKKRREELGMSQEELALKLGYKSRSSINKIELGLSDIPFSKIYKFAKALNMTPEELMGAYDILKKVNEEIFSLNENKIISKKEAEERLLQLEETPEEERSTEHKELIKIYQKIKNTHKDKKEKSNINMSRIYTEAEFMKIPLYTSISAGYGSCESEFIEMIAVPGLKPNGTTYFAVKVDGDSMEPKIPNGSTIIIKKDIVIENGEIGAFCHNEENIVKQKKIIKRKLVLHSFNSNFEDRVIYEFDDFFEYGKVVKVMVDL